MSARSGCLAIGALRLIAPSPRWVDAQLRGHLSKNMKKMCAGMGSGIAVKFYFLKNH